MYNLESEFKRFYGEHVVLPQKEKSSLFAKKNINVKRLKEGLEEYNEEHETDYKLAEEPIVQGSVAMSTVIQNDSNDYDIDVAIVFEKEKIPEGTIATKNMVVNALKKKTKQFKVEPEAKTNCVRIVYADGYHIDFAIYRRFKDENDDAYIYEHCGSEWRERDPRSITKWFLDQNKDKDYKLREVVRLLKMFSKSREGWVNMPGGLIQSVLCDEQFKSYERLDERFYYTVEAINNRLALNKEVYNPVDTDSNLKLVWKDSVRMENLYNRLNDKLSKLDILFDSSCTYKQANEAWEEFFNHEYWTDQKNEKRTEVAKSLALFESENIVMYRETEEFITNLFPVKLQYQVDLDCMVYNKDEVFIGWLQSMIKKRSLLLPNHILIFKAEPINIPSPYRVFWKVKNRGEIAKRADCIRGEIVESDEPLLLHQEHTQYKGDHYVECYIIKNGICVARKRIDVQIRVS